jgi:hypothetical protein
LKAAPARRSWPEKTRRKSPNGGDLPPQVTAFLAWARGHLKLLQGSVSVAQIEKERAWSELFK